MKWPLKLTSLLLAARYCRAFHRPSYTKTSSGIAEVELKYSGRAYMIWSDCVTNDDIKSGIVLKLDTCDFFNLFKTVDEVFRTLSTLKV